MLILLGYIKEIDTNEDTMKRYCITGTKYLYNEKVEEEISEVIEANNLQEAIDKVAEKYEPYDDCDLDGYEL